MNILEEYRLRKQQEAEAGGPNKKTKSFEKGPEHLVEGARVIINQLMRTAKGSKRKETETTVSTVKDTLFDADEFRFRKVPMRTLEDGSTHHEAFGRSHEGTYAILPKGDA